MINHCEIPVIPADLAGEFFDFGVVIRDGSCGEPVAWGYKPRKVLGSDNFNRVERETGGIWTCIGPGDWVLVVRRLTVSDAVEMYGGVSGLELGPRGGFRSVTFGKRRFVQKDLDPRRSQ